MMKKLALLAVILPLTATSQNGFAGEEAEQPKDEQDGKYTLEIRFPVARDEEQDATNTSEETEQPVNPGFTLSSNEQEDSEKPADESDDNSRG